MHAGKAWHQHPVAISKEQPQQVVSCCVIDSLVDNNLLVQLPVEIGEYHHRSVFFLHQPDVDFAHFFQENLPSGRSRFARQISDVVKGRSDVVLKPPLDPPCAISQRVGDGGLVGRVTVLGGNGDDAFLFWATCSTGTAAVGDSTGAAGRRVHRPVDDDRGGVVKGPFPVVLAGEAGFRLPEETVPGGLATGFGPHWTSLNIPGLAGGGTKDGTADGS